MNNEQPNLSTDNHLEISHRVKLQANLVNLFVGPNSTTEKRNEFLSKNAQEIGQLIDSPENEEIRRVARQGHYDEAASQIKNILEANNE